MPQRLYAKLLRLPIILRTLFLALSAIISFGALIHIIEPSTFPSIFDGIWWAIITTSTVGYGDFAPKTIPGRITGMFLILTGAGFLSFYFVNLATATVTRQNAYLEGKVAFKGMGHLIIIGWNERSREIIHHLSNAGHKQQIILIDETLESNPMPNILHFVKGRANQDETLVKANIFKAEKVLITSDQHQDELHADMFSILALLTIKGLCPSVYCIVEVLTTEQLANAKRAGADEIIQSNVLTSFVMENSITARKKMPSMLELIGQLNGGNLTLCEASENLIGKSFKEASSLLLAEGVLIIGIKRGEETFINPSHPFIISKNDQLLKIIN
ncbi:TrkA-N domain protein [Bacillus methanolicus PB1]|uniref:TrkA-N domain protein n=1 Tax=Bacillus methanolicus PB1 TaxID=997296 RepID=I3E2K2_BACMT|nr:potassium channel family protein [Bacillus methanolicus]EIJ80723.1 TrkA-N domain protein [Bacillus methanolicus PB1]